MFLAILLMLGGFVGLILGGDYLVKGASRLASLGGVSPLVIGLTVVAFGTSAPEFAVSLEANLEGKTGLAVGNIVGSNIFNVLSVLGLSAIVAPLLVASQLIRFDVPLMIAASVLMLVFGLDGSIHWIDGAILFAGLIFYLFYSIVQSRRETKAVQEEFESEYKVEVPRTWLFTLAQFGWVILGLGLLTLGSNLLVNGASSLAQIWGMSDLLIGLTIVAVGTSLPEIAASMVASFRGERDIAVGNVVGSNIFNILGVLGLSALIAPAGIPVDETAIRFDIPIMIAVAVACLPIFMTGHRINRWEGACFLLYYVAYMIYLILAALDSAIADGFGWFLIAFMVPVAAVAILLSLFRSFSGKRSTQEGTNEAETVSDTPNNDG